MNHHFVADRIGDCPPLIFGFPIVKHKTFSTPSVMNLLIKNGDNKERLKFKRIKKERVNKKGKKLAIREGDSAGGGTVDTGEGFCHRP